MAVLFGERLERFAFGFWGLEGAFGQLEDGGLFEDVGSGGWAQKFQSA